MKQLKKIHHSSEIKSFILYEILKIRYIFGIQKLMTYCTLINNSNRFLVLILKVTLLKIPSILIFCLENLLKKQQQRYHPLTPSFLLLLKMGDWGFGNFLNRFWTSVCGYIKDISAYYMRCFDVNVLFWQFYPMFVY